MTPVPPCLRERLADGPLATIERCSCGAVHLTLGALTLRLQEDALRSFTMTLREAVEALEAPGRCEPSSLRLGGTVRGAS